MTDQFLRPVDLSSSFFSTTMKRRCKNRLVNPDVVKGDLISELPEPLLLQILSSLPSETAIATSVLSKRWKSLWKMIPNLRFDSRYHVTFAANVSISLILHKAPVLESLNLTFGYKCDPLEMALLMGIAFSRKVRKLVLKLEKEDDEDPFIFPDIVFRCNNTLEILKLKGLILFDLTSPICLNALRELHLYYIKFDDEESISNLLCGCPRLQDLVWHAPILVGVHSITIAVPSLQRLTLIINDGTDDDGGYVINAPSLKYLFINGFSSIESCLIENAPELEEAKIIEVSGLENENILESLVAAKRLSLSVSPLEIKYPVGKIFYQLLSLELDTTEEEWWNLLSLLLESSPRLQILKLIGHHYPVEKPWKWNQPRCVPECLLFHLETFVWTRYMEHGNEKEVATYIFENAQCLKRATFLTNKPTTLEIEKSREMLNQLANEVRASNSCHLVFKSDRYVDRCRMDADLNEYVYYRF